MRSPRIVARSLLAAGALALAATAAGATVTTDLCTGNPCIVGSSRTVDAGSVLDFGSATELRLAANVVVTVGPGTQPRSVTLRAGKIVLLAGAKIAGGGDGAFVELDATAGDLSIQASGAKVARIDVSGNAAGNVTLTATGAIAIDGVLDATGSGADSEGGDVSVAAGTILSGAGSLLASGSGSGGAGGSLDLSGATGVNLTGTLDTSGADGGGGDISVGAAAGNVSLGGSISVSGGNPDGSAGSITLGATAGDIVLSAGVTGKGGTGAQDACGDGAEMTLNAGGSIVLSGAISISGGKQCLGGSFTATAGKDFTQQVGGDITAQAPGAFGEGGDIEITAGGNATTRNIDVSSPGAGGTVNVTASAVLSALGNLNASGTASDAFAGSVSLQACQLTVAAGAQLSSLGTADTDTGSNTLAASGAMTVSGTLQAAASNELDYRSTLPTVTGSLTPAATLVNDPSLPACPIIPVCGNHVTEGDEACDDGNTVSCDGCSADCSRVDHVCGDGVKECGEACDDGNQVSGDGCEPDCTITPLTGVRRPGRPLEATGCMAEWSLPDGAALDDGGFAKAAQSCTDGDPTCDTDGAVNGVCTFSVRACLHVPDPNLSSCSQEDVNVVKIKSPRSKGGDATDTENSLALRAALMALGGTVREGAKLVQSGNPISGEDECTTPISLKVPTAGDAAAGRKFNLAARDALGTAMSANPLNLECQPHVDTCGDGVVEPGEECDLGSQNGQSGSRCTTDCKLLPPAMRIPGGSGRASADCPFEWAAELDPQDVRANRKGVPSYGQTCRDNDPSCDLDPTPGTCRIQLWGCFGGADGRLGCPATQVQAFQIIHPAATVSKPYEVGARNAMLAAFSGITFPTGPGEVCTPRFTVDLPAGAMRLHLSTEATFGPKGRKESDALVLRCEK